MLQSNYTWDEKSRIQTIQHTQTGATLQFGYDSDDRLTSYINPGGSSTETGGQSALVGVEPPATTNSYHLDGADNWTDLTINGASTSFVPNNLNQYASIGALTPSYDNNGNLTSYNGWSFVYDAENHLRTVSGPSTTIQYDYDGLGRCVVQTLNGVAQFNVYDHWKMVIALNVYGNIVVQNVYGRGRHEIVCTGQSGSSNPYFYHQDHRGNVTGITDNTGTMQETVMYDPYGRPYLFNRAGTTLSKSQFGNIFYMSGRPFTPLTGWNSGIYDLRARFYAADIGRFMQCDPLGFKAGGNLYAYAGNNPVSRSDPYGKFFMDDSDGDGGGEGGDDGGFGGGDGGFGGGGGSSPSGSDNLGGLDTSDWGTTGLTQLYVPGAIDNYDDGSSGGSNGISDLGAALAGLLGDAWDILRIPIMEGVGLYDIFSGNPGLGSSEMISALTSALVPKYGWYGSPGWGNGSYFNGWLEGPGNWFNLPPIDQLDALYQQHDQGFNVPPEQLYQQGYRFGLDQQLIQNINGTPPEGPFGGIYGQLSILFFTLYDGLGLHN